MTDVSPSKINTCTAEPIHLTLTLPSGLSAAFFLSSGFGVSGPSLPTSERP
jgi:hypothetical protein